MYSNLGEVYILLDKSEFENILPEDQLSGKLDAYRGVKARNNRLILGYLASQGPSLPYDIFKALRDLDFFKDNQYPTVHRRVKALTKKGYVTEAGTRSTLRGKQSEEIQYGLSLQGLIASLAIESIRWNVLHTFECHMNTIVPEKVSISNIEVDAQKLAIGILTFIGKIYSREEIYALVTAVFLGYLNTSTPPLEELLHASTEEWMPWIKPIIGNAVIEQKRLLPQGIEKTTNLFLLLDDPAIFDLVMAVLPVISAYLTNQIRTYYKWLIAANGFNEAFNELTPDQMSSKRAEDFVANELPDLYQEFEESIREYEGSVQ